MFLIKSSIELDENNGRGGGFSFPLAASGGAECGWAERGLIVVNEPTREIAENEACDLLRGRADNSGS